MYKFFVSFLVLITYIGFSYGDCMYNKAGFWECKQTKNIILNQDMDKTITPEEMNINLADMDFSSPKECKTDFCYKESEITIIVRKTRKPMATILNDTGLTSWDFAQNFPNITEKKLLNNTSPVYDRLILQKVLYERGLLASKPTGKLGYLTEQAIMRLQCLKGFTEYDQKKSIFIIGPKTIQETNKIKDKMENAKYLKITRIPNIDFAKCGNVFEKRNEKLNTLLGNPPVWANNSYINGITPDYAIKPEGEVKIKKEIINNK